MDQIDGDSVRELIAALRRVGTESESVEAKSGRGGFPRSLRESLVAFANTRGGTILVGVDELEDFAIVSLTDPAGYRDQLVGIARDAVTPPLAVSADVVEVDGGVVVAAYVPPLPPDQRPAYVTAKGFAGGTYVRTGDGDHPLGQSELALVVANRTQPVYDREPVPGTRVGDLDRASLLRSLQRVRGSSPRLRELDEADLLHRLGVLAEPDPDASVTLAGLLTFGELPQQWFPQLMVSVAVHPAGDVGRTRFLDNETLRGPIPELVVQAESMVRRHLAVRADIGDLGRRDVPEIPPEVVRELVVNALLHRDYSPQTRGTQVAVNLYADRLEVRSPGGIFGLSEDDLGQVGASSSRNQVLAALLADAYLPGSDELVAENRASGIPAIIMRARENGLAPPRFRSTTTAFAASIDRRPLLDGPTRDWITGVAPDAPAEIRTALAILRRGPVTERALRGSGMPRLEARRTLRDLVVQGLAVEVPDAREPHYRLDPRAIAPGPPPATERVQGGVPAAVLDAVRGRSGITARVVAETTGLSRPTVTKYLGMLLDAGKLRATGALRSPRREYHWVASTDRS